LTDRDFDSLFTVDKPVIFNFHGYPWLIHRLAYRRTNHNNMHVRGYKEKGNINTPMELAINNEIDRFSLAIDAIDRTPRLQRIGAHAKERFRNMQIDCRNYAYENRRRQPRNQRLEVAVLIAIVARAVLPAVSRLVSTFLRGGTDDRFLSSVNVTCFGEQ